MILNPRIRRTLLLVICFTSPLFAQSVPRDVFLDPDSAAACDVVNAGNAELVVRSDTGQLVVIAGDVPALDPTFVDGQGIVSFGGFPFGVIIYATDGDGIRTLWWRTAPDGTVVEINPLTQSPSATNFFPDDFSGVPCDACQFLDDPVYCFLDQDLDKVEDSVDACPDTPIDEQADEHGCSCSQNDGDGDQINDCVDQCPASHPGDDVDSRGCVVVVVPSGPPIVISCGNFTSLTLMTTLAGLTSLRWVRRRITAP